MCPGPRAIEEDMVPFLRHNYLSPDGTALCVPARDLVKAGMRHFHPELVEWLWDAPQYFGYPSYMMFDVPDQGILAHCYILHPVVINAAVRNAPFLHVFDQDYLQNACPDLSKIYVAQDSDEVFHFELSPRDTSLPPPARPVRPDPELEVMWYGEKQYNTHHRAFAKLPIRIHHATMDPAAWRVIEERAAAIIDRIDRGWDIPDWLLAYRHPDHLIRRLEARHRHDGGASSPEEQRLLDRANEVAARRPPPREGPAAIDRPPVSFLQQQGSAGSDPASADGAEPARKTEVITATGRDRATAKRLQADLNHVRAQEPGAGVVLPPGRVGSQIVVIADAAINVYATGIDDIDGVAGSVGCGLESGGYVQFLCVKDLDWISVQVGTTPSNGLSWRSIEERILDLVRFDQHYYLAENKDVSESGMDAALHYEKFGWKEGRDPSPYFSTRGYLRENTDIAAAFYDPLQHFIQYGIKENRKGWQKQAIF